MAKLTGKVAIVTGAGSGMGAVEARLFAEEGASVLITDVREEPIKALAEQLQAGGFSAAFAVLDVTSEEQWTKAVEGAVDAFGKVDILVNNAGIAGPATVWKEATYADFKRIMDINVNSQYLGIQAVLPEMTKAGGGAIVNISSTAGFIAFPNTHPAYTASKGASRLLTKSAAADVAAIGIRVNSVHPGLVDTPMNDYLRNHPDALEEILKLVPMRRMADPVEIARAVLFLASDDASFITGTELLVDGGQTCI